MRPSLSLGTERSSAKKSERSNFKPILLQQDMNLQVVGDRGYRVELNLRGFRLSQARKNTQLEPYRVSNYGRLRRDVSASKES